MSTTPPLTTVGPRVGRTTFLAVVISLSVVAFVILGGVLAVSCWLGLWWFGGPQQAPEAPRPLRPGDPMLIPMTRTQRRRGTPRPLIHPVHRDGIIEESNTIRKGTGSTEPGTGGRETV